MMAEFTPTEPKTSPLHHAPRPCGPESDQAWLSDEQLVERALAGQQEVWDELFSRHWKAAEWLASRRLPNAADAQDAIQEAFRKAFTQLHTLDRPSSFRSWLHTLVRNAATDIQRRQRRKLRQSRSGAAEEYREAFHPCKAPPPVEELPAKGPRTILDELIDCEATERAEALEREVKSILELHRTTRRMCRVYELRLQRLTFAEIATQLNSELIEGGQGRGRKQSPMTKEKARNDMRKVRAILEQHRTRLMQLLW